MPKFIKVTDYGSGIDIWLNGDNVHSIHRPPGTECTAIKSLSTYEQVRETPEEVVKLIEGVS
jgi:uncharacterized protein YlzI (FlbEa/FlbD family)